jgi:hypothetical protein
LLELLDGFVDTLFPDFFEDDVFQLFDVMQTRRLSTYAKMHITQRHRFGETAEASIRRQMGISALK